MNPDLFWWDPVLMLQRTANRAADRRGITAQRKAQETRFKHTSKKVHALPKARAVR